MFLAALRLLDTIHCTFSSVLNCKTRRATPFIFVLLIEFIWPLYQGCTVALVLKDASEYKTNNVYYFDLKFSFLACTCTQIFLFVMAELICRILDFKNQYFKRNNLILLPRPFHSEKTWADGFVLVED